MPDDDILAGRRAVEPEPIDVTPPPRESAADQRKRPPSRSKMITVVAVAAVGLVGAGFLAAAGWRVAQQKDATLGTPARAAGLVLDESERAFATADYLRTALAARIDLDTSIGAVYADPADSKRSVLLFGGTTLLWSPERDLDTLFDVVSDDAGSVSGLREVSAGKLGGVMKCGTTRSEDGDIAVCGWADHGSVALGMFPGRRPADAGTLLRDLRAAIQHRS
ncbi:hypothetical protein SAMN05444365_108157 [Micromonospora pattaloongensis]|uniref:Uncharacterized protein n=1 Tax=Micromonospora pattaloongensis TaxID=405436 RepID=A0A1H3RN49_9ACTN|nr:hypothetical protein [Micromonospora pattaloongensis]SDZ26795.1 hypothetical protein SAMN05444365_108157 [Micromonospora pattaloongensis]